MSVQEEGTKVPSDLEKVTIPESQTQSDSKDEAQLVQTSTGVNGAASPNDDPFMYSPPDVAAPLKDQEPIIDSHLSELLFTSGPFASTLSSDSIISSSNRLKNLAVRLVIVRTNRSLIKSVNEILSRDGADGVDRIKLEAFTKDLMEDMKDGKLDESKRKAADLVEGSVWKSLDEVIGGLWEETVKIEVGEVQFLIGSWLLEGHSRDDHGDYEIQEYICSSLEVERMQVLTDVALDEVSLLQEQPEAPRPIANGAQPTS